MRLFGKHVFRSIRRAPLQPLFIVITLAFSVAALVLAARTALAIRQQNNEQTGADSYICDLTLRPSAESGVGLMLADGVKEALGEDGTALGEFELTVLASLGGKPEMHQIVAAPLLEADRFYGFRYTEYGSFTRENLDSSIILSRDAAEEYGIALGDALRLELLGYSLELTVEAIVRTEGTVNGRLGYIDVSAVIEELARRNPAIASFADGFLPYTSVRIRLSDPERADGVAARLSENAALSGVTVINESDNTGNLDSINFISVVITEVAALIVTLLSAIVITTSLDLLHKKRRHETALFMLCGADPDHLAALRYTEALVYGAAGAALSMLLLLPGAAAINTLFEWDGAISIGPADLGLTLLGAPALMMLITFLNVKKTKKAQLAELANETNASPVAEPHGIWRAATVTALAAASLLTALLLPTRYGYLAAIPAMLFTVLCAFGLSPIVTKRLFGMLSRLLSSRRRLPARIYLASRSIFSSYPLRHIGRTVTVVITLVCSVFICLSATAEQVEAVKGLVDCEYIAFGATRSTEKELAADGEIDALYRIGIISDAVTVTGSATICISADEGALRHITPSLAPSKLPSKGGAAVSKGLARLSSSTVGGEISLYLETKEYRFTVTEIIDTPANIVFVDAEQMGRTNDLLCLKMKDGSADGNYYRLRSELEAKGSQLTRQDTVIGPLSGRMDKYVTLLQYATVISVLIAALGVVNLLISERSSRTQERRSLCTAGMTRRGVRSLELTELALTSLAALLTAIPATALFCLAVDLTVGSFGAALF